MENRDFGWALKQLKAGKRVRREGWNGKGMWIALTPGSAIKTSEARAGATKMLADDLESHPALKDDTKPITIHGHIDMKAADGTIVIGWLASQTDVLSEDWMEVK